MNSHAVRMDSHTAVCQKIVAKRLMTTLWGSDGQELNDDWHSMEVKEQS